MGEAVEKCRGHLGVTEYAGPFTEAGCRPLLNILGKPVGTFLTGGRLLEKETGSIIVIVGTDAPLSSLSLRHVARRAEIGIGRTGTPGGNNSGDIFPALSVANLSPMPQLSPPRVSRPELNMEYLDHVHLAAVKAVNEAVVNALVAGEDVAAFKPKGHLCRAINTLELGRLFA